MRRILLGAALALSLAANMAVAAIALSRSAPRAAPGEPPLFSKVALDADQRARILALREQLLASREEQASQLAERRARLADLLTRDVADLVAIDATLDEIQAAQAAFQRRVVAHVVSVRAVLRADQRPAFEALVRTHMRTGIALDPAAPPPGGSGGRP